jgi:uncharacterized membrane protein YhhN
MRFRTQLSGKFLAPTVALAAFLVCLYLAIEVRADSLSRTVACVCILVLVSLAVAAGLRRRFFTAAFAASLLVTSVLMLGQQITVGDGLVSRNCASRLSAVLRTRGST